MNTLPHQGRLAVAWGANVTGLAHELGVRVCAGTDMMGDPAVDPVPNIHKYGLFHVPTVPNVHMWGLYMGASFFTKRTHVRTVHACLNTPAH